MKKQPTYEWWTVILTIISAVLILVSVVAIRFVWAKYVYKDTRCAWAECRISK